jgi:FkbM family methyltransferase
MLGLSRRQKQLITRPARRFAETIGLVDIRPEPMVGSDERWGIDLLPIIVRDLVRRRGEPVRLVQIGANDGVKADPVRMVIEQGLVEALLIEPLPVQAEALRTLHAGRPDVTIRQVAVGPEPGRMRMFVIQNETTGQIHDDLATLDRAFAEKGVTTLTHMPITLPGSKFRIDELEVDVVRLAEVLSAQGWADVDVCVVDAEALDDAIVLDLLGEGLRPELIAFESFNLTVARFRKVIDSLNQAGYRTARSGYDTFALLGKSNLELSMDSGTN